MPSPGLKESTQVISYEKKKIGYNNMGTKQEHIVHIFFFFQSRGHKEVTVLFQVLFW